jgi:hypothetical protein
MTQDFKTFLFFQDDEVPDGAVLQRPHGEGLPGVRLITLFPIHQIS